MSAREQTPGAAVDGAPRVRAAGAAEGGPWRSRVAREVAPGSAGFLDAAWLRGPGRDLWIAELGGEPVGCLVGEHGPDRFEIHVLLVPSRWRRRGVAAAMVRHACEEAEAGTARAIGLEVRVSNHAARSLYAGAGFREVGRRPGYYPDGEDALLLERALGAPTRDGGDRSPPAGSRGAERPAPGNGEEER